MLFNHYIMCIDRNSYFVFASREFVQSSGADNEVPTQMSDPKAEPTVASVPLHKLVSASILLIIIVCIVKSC